jgi:hypothetical protein
LAQAEERED